MITRERRAWWLHNITRGCSTQPPASCVSHYLYSHDRTITARRGGRPHLLAHQVVNNNQLETSIITVTNTATTTITTIRHNMELKVWVEGIQRIVCGVTEKTTCQVT